MYCDEETREQNYFKDLQMLTGSSKKQPETEMLSRLIYFFKLHGYFQKFEGHYLSDTTIRPRDSPTQGTLRLRENINDSNSERGLT